MEKNTHYTQSLITRPIVADKQLQPSLQNLTSYTSCVQTKTLVTLSRPRELPTTADLILVWRGRDRFRPFDDHSRLLPASSDGRQSL